jgi:RNA polymerase sigma factor (TIGR02999 family)
MSEVTRILSAIEDGDPQAAEQLLPLVYDELRKLAAQKLAQEKPGQTLQATALVHEAYIRLVASGDASAPREQHWNSRGHFFAAAAEAMRRILVEKARRKHRLRRGGGWKRLELETLDLADDEAAKQILALDEALERFVAEDKAGADLVQLRYFAGLTIQEAACALGISVRTANRHWAYAKAWLFQQLGQQGKADQ